MDREMKLLRSILSPGGLPRRRLRVGGVNLRRGFKEATPRIDFPEPVAGLVSGGLVGLGSCRHEYLQDDISLLVASLVAGCGLAREAEMAKNRMPQKQKQRQLSWHVAQNRSPMP